MAEQNYSSQKSPAASEAGVGEQHFRQAGATRSPADESGGKQQTKDLRPSARGAVTRGGVLDDAAKRLRTLKQDTDDYVRKNPTKAVLTALGIGFVLALMRRR